MRSNTLPTPGAIARFDLDDGDSYIGEIVAIRGDLVTLRNYSAWYEGDAEPYNSEAPDIEVRFRIDSKTRIEQF